MSDALGNLHLQGKSGGLVGDLLFSDLENMFRARVSEPNPERKRLTFWIFNSWIAPGCFQQASCMAKIMPRVRIDAVPN